MAQKDPLSEERWKDRYGIAYGKGLKKVGNVESHLSYSKLHRTGKLLRNLHSKVVGKDIILGNRVKYAEEHEKGSMGTKTATIKPPYVRGGANAVITGGKIQARPFMNPSKKILKMPRLLIHKKIRSFGWGIGAI